MGGGCWVKGEGRKKNTPSCLRYSMGNKTNLVICFCINVKFLHEEIIC